MLLLEPKAPGEVIFYDFDWAAKRLDDGEIIVSSDWEVALGSVEVASSPPPFELDGVTRVYVQGGLLGETCVVTNFVETNLNPRRDFSGKIKIKLK